MSTDNRYHIHTLSYLALRKSIGFIGMLLPFVLMLGVTIIFKEDALQDSISHYYYTGMRDVFVGALCAVSLFMFFYCGYERIDDWAGNAAAIFALGVAFFPTTETGDADLIGKVHFSSAAALFIILAFFSLYLFTRTDPNKPPTSQKLKRNVIYRICGVIIILCIVSIAVYSFFIEDMYMIPRFVFWGETIALVAFGFSWCVKGEVVLKDS